MTLITRRIIALFFTAIFLATTPIVLLYTAGFRYNFTKNKLEKTGVLFLDSEPSGATILLNNKKLKPKTPAHLTALLPGEYGVELKKDRYLPWKKTLTVESAKTLFATQVFLPRESALVPLSDIDAEDIYLSPSEKLLLTRKTVGTKTVFGLYTIDEKRSTVLGLFETHGKPMQIQWSPDSKIIIARIRTIPEQFLVIDVLENSISSLGQFFETPIRTVKFDLNAQNIVIVGTARGRFRFNVTTKSKNQIDTNTYEGYVIQRGLLYRVEQKLNQTTLVAEEVATKNSTPTVITTLPRGTYTFLQSPDNFILVKDARNTIFLVQLDSKPRVILEAEADEVSWGRSGAAWKLLYQHNFELWLFHASNEEKELITRLSTSIKKSTFLPDGEHVLFLSNNVMRLIELDKRGGRNVWTIEDLHDISSFALNPSDFRSYFTGKQTSSDNQTLYSREMR